MLSSEYKPISVASATGSVAAATGTGSHTGAQVADPKLTTELLELDLLELELLLDGFKSGQQDFAAYVRAAIVDIDGALLFELPASGLVANCMRIAVLRIARDDSLAMTTVFACLEADGTTIRIEKPDERTADLQNFAEAFVDVLQRI